MELTTKGQEIMAKMADLHAEQTAIPTFLELQQELERLVKAEHPEETLAMTYTRCYGILLANITTEQMLTIVNRRKKAL
jgi:organic hydroperoxide reductase OsmC/OhrA